MMNRPLVSLISVMLLSGCLDPEPTFEGSKALGCERSADCPTGYSCTEGACIDPSKCGDGIVQIGEVCDDGDANSDDWSLEPHCNASCSGNAPHCGDGDITDAETCDAGDGNTASYTATPGCNTTCTGSNPHCGDGETQESELCDEGDSNTDVYSASEVCNSTCNGLAPRCGDGVPQEGEGETCDDGVANSNAYAGTSVVCNGTCSGEAPRCGDGILQSDSEVCDDGNLENGDYCQSDCQAVLTMCGDGTVEGDEVCDDGPLNTDSYALEPTCNQDCSGFASYCGDGIPQLDDGEVCDSGTSNTDSYSAVEVCNSTCNGFAPRCGDGVLQADHGEVCDDGDANSDSYSFAEHCNGSCTANYSGGYCGDGNINAPFETCDDGNDSTSDSCPSGSDGPCQNARCGDGLIWNMDGGVETCEPGVSQALSCEEVDNAELDGVATCSEVFCRYNSSECFDGPSGFVRIESGTFTMGSPPSELGRDSDETQHQVTLTRNFYIMEHEVTQGQWQALVGNNPSNENNGTCDDCPVERVSWWGALYYANSLSGLEELTPCYVLEGCSGTAGVNLSCSSVAFQDGNGNAVTTPYECAGYRLPTEAEWEYAARAGTTTAFYNGDITETSSDPNADAIAWYGPNAGFTTHAVKGKLLNGFGLYDTSGNVREWTWDWSGSYAGDVTDPTGPNTGSTRVLRGGSWLDTAQLVRAAKRADSAPDYRSLSIGFRLARTVE